MKHRGKFIRFSSGIPCMVIFRCDALSYSRGLLIILPCIPTRRENYEINAWSLGMEVVPAKRFTFKFFENLVSCKIQLAPSHFVCLLANFHENSRHKMIRFHVSSDLLQLSSQVKIYLRYLKLPPPLPPSFFSFEFSFLRKTISDTRPLPP